MRRQLDAAGRQRQLLASKFDDGLQYPFPEDLAVQSRAAPIRAGTSVLEADLEEILELNMAGRGSVHELLQSDVGDDRTRACIAFAVASIVLVIRPRPLGALGEYEPSA